METITTGVFSLDNKACKKQISKAVAQINKYLKSANKKGDDQGACAFGLGEYVINMHFTYNTPLSLSIFINIDGKEETHTPGPVWKARNMKRDIREVLERAIKKA